MSCNSNIIILRQGDDSDFNDNGIVININADIDLVGWKARLQLQELVKDYDDITSGKIAIEFSKEETSNLQTGDHRGWIKLIDSQGRECTVLSQPFRILRREVR